MGKDVVDVLQEIAASIDTRVFDAKIRQSVIIESAQAERIDIYTYSPKSKVAMDYQEFSLEVLNALEDKE